MATKTANKQPKEETENQDLERFTDEQLADIREAFDMFDHGHHGYISENDLGMALRTVGLNPPEKDINEIINSADSDGNKKIDFVEFLALVAQMMDEPNSEDEVREAFRVFACGCTEGIPTAELRRVILYLQDPELSEQDTDDLMRAADPNSDGHVTFAEFAKLMNMKPNHKPTTP